MNYFNPYFSDAATEAVRYAVEHTAFYKEKFKGYKDLINKIDSYQEFCALPFTSKNDLQIHNSDFLAVAPEKIKEYCTTSGTLGTPVSIALTDHDLDRLAINEYQSFAIAGTGPQDIFQLSLTLDKQFMAGMAYYSGIRKLGGTVIRTGPGVPGMQWNHMLKYKTTVLVAVPSFVVKLLDYAIANNLDFKGTSVHTIICIGEPIRNEYLELNTLGKKIRDLWDIKMISTYAATEIQSAYTECTPGSGVHEQANLVFTEIIDADGNPLPEGEYGEVVVSTIGVEGMPMIRYQTGDIAAFIPGDCDCGRKTRRLYPVKGRKQQMIKYKGTTIFPAAIVQLLNDRGCIDNYIIEIKKDELGMDALTISLCGTADQYTSISEIQEEMRSRFRLKMDIQFMEESIFRSLQFPEGARKPIRILDLRN